MSSVSSSCVGHHRGANIHTLLIPLNIEANIGGAQSCMFTMGTTTWRGGSYFYIFNIEWISIPLCLCVSWMRGAWYSILNLQWKNPTTKQIGEITFSIRSRQPTGTFTAALRLVVLIPSPNFVSGNALPCHWGK